MSRPEHRWPVVGVVGGCGGAGASALCAALAGAPTAVRGRLRAGRSTGRRAGPPPGVAGPAVLVDLDGMGAGIDVLLGAENSPGARWSGLHATGDRLDPAQLRDGLPRWWGVPFLACDGPHEPAPEAVRSVVGAARQLGPVILDLGRSPGPARSAALAEADVVVLLVPAEIRAVAAGAAQQASLDDVGHAGAQVLVARLDRPVIEPRRMAAVLGLDLAGVIGIDRALRGGRDRGIEPHRLARSTVALVRDVMAVAGESAAGSGGPSGGAAHHEASRPAAAGAVGDPAERGPDGAWPTHAAASHERRRRR